MPRPTCPQCGVREATMVERLEYVATSGKRRRTSDPMRVICSTCADLNIESLPERASWVDVIDALKRYAMDQTDPMWEKVERAVGPFLAMGIQEPML